MDPLRYTANLCIIATGDYQRFLGPLLDSAANYFAVDHAPTVHVFTDCAEHSAWDRKRSEHEAPIVVHRVPHEPWPGPTLHRYRVLLQAAEQLRQRTHTFYVDADMRFVRPVCDEIFGEIVATLHAGFVAAAPSTLPYENRPESAAFVGWRDRRRYFCGGFQGGRTDRWLEAMAEMDQAIARDEAAGITAVWHDESHWNAYLVRHPPAYWLSADYCAHEGAAYSNPRTAKIVSLKKENSQWHR